MPKGYSWEGYNSNLLEMPEPRASLSFFTVNSFLYFVCVFGVFVCILLVFFSIIFNFVVFCCI